MSKHSPLPWRTLLPNDTLIVSATGVETAQTLGDYHAGDADVMEADAAFIVRACNSHHDLLEALRYYASPEAWTVNQVEGADGDYGAKARAAIAKATGEA